jgi:hypothetical protein
MSLSVAGIVLPRLAGTVVALALIAWSATEINSARHTATVRFLAEAIEGGRVPRQEVLDRLHDDEAASWIMRGCDGRSLRALATVRLKELDLAVEMTDGERADRAYEAGEAALYRALRCAPLDGNLWLRLAIVDAARGGPALMTVEFLKLSHWTAPSEASIVRARVAYVSSLREAGIEEIREELRSDIRTLINYDSVRNVAELYVAAPKSVLPIYQEWIALLPEDRRQSLAGAVERRGGNLSGS